MEKLKVAVIGAGQIVRASHIDNYRSKEAVEIVGVCDTRIEAAKALAEDYGIANYYDSHIAMLEELKPDAVSVCVPNAFHSRLTLDALERGCHVYCEKPPAITVEEVEEMRRAAKENGRLLTFGFHFRHGRNVEVLKNKIEAGEFGQIYSAKAKWLRRRGIPGWGNFTNKAMQGGGPLIDIGSHMLDLAFYLLDYPEIEYLCAVSHDKIGKKGGQGLMGAWDGERFTVEDSLFGMIRFRNGADLRIETSFALNMKEKDERNVELFGEKMGASLFPLQCYSEEEGMPVNLGYPYIPEEDDHRKAIHNFVDACLGKEPLLVTADQAVYVQKVLCALYQSADSGKPVWFEANQQA